MEVFKKQISIDSYISRQHSLIPYINKKGDETSKLIMDKRTIDITSFSENGNWGKYPCDIDLERCERFVDFRGNEIIPRNFYSEKYFQSNIVSFLELSDKFNCFKKILRESKFLISIQKNNELIWVEYTPTLFEKLSCAIVDQVPMPTKRNTIIGVHEGTYFSDNGGNNMLSFLIKAMGLFIVNKAYISNDNGVPEIMYYAGIKEYLRRMEAYKNSNDCCKSKEYEFLGGDIFYHYLNVRLTEIEEEIKYWHKALSRDENLSIEVSEPHINMNVALNSDSNIIGNYMCVDDTENGVLINKFNAKTIEIESQLKYLRRSKISYCEERDDELGDFTTKVFPLILDEIEEGKQLKFVLTQPYQQGYPQNLKQEYQYYYGDMIYRMEFITNEKENDNDIESGVVNIYYVIGGKLRYRNNVWSYVDSDTTQDDIPNFNEFVINPYTSIKWTADNYLFLKNEFSKTDNYENIKNLFFKGDINSESDSIIFKTEKQKDETWVYRITYRGTYEGEECYPDDYLIFYKGEQSAYFHFTMNKITENEFTGIRCYEQKPWKMKNYREDKNVLINMLLSTSIIASNNILLSDLVINSDGVELIDYGSMDNIVTGVFSSNDISSETENRNILMMDYEFGKIDFSVENSSDILIDRGFVSAFEMHYKLGEINTMEDMENYGNNFFGF